MDADAFVVIQSDFEYYLSEIANSDPLYAVITEAFWDGSGLVVPNSVDEFLEKLASFYAEVRPEWSAALDEFHAVSVRRSTQRFETGPESYVARLGDAAALDKTNEVLSTPVIPSHKKLEAAATKEGYFSQETLALRDWIEKKFNIRIAINDTELFLAEHKYSAHYIVDDELVQRQLQVLDQQLGQLPGPYLANSGVKYILLVENLDHSSSSGNIAGANFMGTGVIALDVEDDVVNSFNHEVYHGIDYTFNKLTFNESSWSAQAYAGNAREEIFVAVYAAEDSFWNLFDSDLPGFATPYGYSSYRSNGDFDDDQASCAEILNSPDEYARLTDRAATDKVLERKLSYIKREMYAASEGMMDEIFWRDFAAGVAITPEYWRARSERQALTGNEFVTDALGQAQLRKWQLADDPSLAKRHILAAVLEKAREANFPRSAAEKIIENLKAKSSADYMGTRALRDAKQQAVDDGFVKTAEDFIFLADAWVDDPSDDYKKVLDSWLDKNLSIFFSLDPSLEQIKRLAWKCKTFGAFLSIKKAALGAGWAKTPEDFMGLADPWATNPTDDYRLELSRLMDKNLSQFLGLGPKSAQLREFALKSDTVSRFIAVKQAAVDAAWPKTPGDFVFLADAWVDFPSDSYEDALADWAEKNIPAFFALHPTLQEIKELGQKIHRVAALMSLRQAAIEHGLVKTREEFAFLTDPWVRFPSDAYLKALADFKMRHRPS